MLRKAKTMLVVITCATGVVATSGTAQATSPGRPGALAYLGSGGIYVDRLVAGRVVTKRLTTGWDEHPRWSQDGRKIAYATYSRNIVVMNPDGTGKKTVSVGRSWHPNWMPVPGKASRVGYVKVNAGKGDIYSVAPTGGAATRLTTDGAGQCGNSQPAWSADGKWFAYIQEIKTARGCTQYAPSRLVVINRITGAKRTLQKVTDSGTELVVAGRYFRIDFTADSRSLWFLLGGDDYCVDYSGVYNLATGAVGVNSAYACEGETGLPLEEAPAPGGLGVETDCDPYDGTCWIRTPLWDRDYSDIASMPRDFDMQPLR